MKLPTHKSLFGKPGYLKASDYLENCLERKELSWKLPLGLLERLQFFALRAFLRFSWFSDLLFIVQPAQESPFFAALLKFFQKRGLFDVCVERSLAYPGAYSYYIHKHVTINGKPNYVNAQGIADTPELALSKALGEMFERMISGLWDQNKNITTASVRQLREKKSAIYYPPDFHRFFPIQAEKFPELKHSPDDVTSWVAGRKLSNKQVVYIPRQVTSWFEGTRNSSKVFINATTNGSAAYFTREGAILRGLLETIQRDGFFTHWLTKTIPNVITIESLPNELREKVNIFQSLGATITILDLQSMNVPCVCVVAQTKNAKVPAVAVSAAANLTYYEAIEDALREMIGGIEPLYRTHLTPLDDSESVNKWSLNKLSRQSYWRGDEAIANISWFISGPEVTLASRSSATTTQYNNDQERLKHVELCLKPLGDPYQPVIYEPINPLTKEVGMYVVQVFIPKAFPLYLLEKYATFASERLADFTQEKRGTKSYKLNTCPHLFS